jgi:hypothetical protein
MGAAALEPQRPILATLMAPPYYVMSAMRGITLTAVPEQRRNWLVLNYK